MGEEKPHLFGKFINVVKFLWVIIVFAAAGIFLIQNAKRIDLTAFTLPRFLLACALLIVAKLLLVEQSRLSVALVADKPSTKRMFYINALSQLAKYIPGGIWHLAGRGGYYRADGLTAREITRAIVVDNIWLINAAVLYGALLHGVATHAAWLLLAGLVAGWCAILAAIEYVIVGKVNIGRVFGLAGLQMVIWTCIGFNFWVLSASLAAEPLQVLSAMSLSWAVGYIVIIAPGGIGVREAALMALLALSGATAASLVTLNRFSWIIVELILSVLAMLSTIGAGTLRNSATD
jgi:uncharacterized membrane protein YbhN (UPF0104 family)